MSAHKFTSGPWNKVLNRILDSNGLTVAETYPFGENETSKANGQLIAAAPELLEALEMALQFFGSGLKAALSDSAFADEEGARLSRSINQRLDIMRAAIAKATAPEKEGGEQ